MKEMAVEIRKAIAEAFAQTIQDSVWAAEGIERLRGDAALDRFWIMGRPDLPKSMPHKTVAVLFDNGMVLAGHRDWFMQKNRPMIPAGAKMIAHSIIKTPPPPSKND